MWALLITFSLLLAAILLLDAAYYKGIEAFGSLLAAIASVAAVFIAVTSLQVAIRRQREELMQQTQIFSAEFISGLDERFTNMKEVRAAAAKYLLTKPSADISSEEHQRGLNAVAEVLGFFESMAFFARRGVLDKEFVWTHYYLIMLPYWHFFQKLPGMKKP